MATVLTAENAQEFYARKLGIEDARVAGNEPDVDTAADTQKVSEKPAEEQAAEEGEHAEDVSGKDDEPKRGNPKLEKRFSELTAKRKAAEERAAEAERKLQEAEKRARELELKANPPPPDDPGPEPDPKDYQDIEKYRADLKTWTRNSVTAEAKKQEAERKQREYVEDIQKKWRENTAAVRKEVPDFDEVVAEAQKPFKLDDNGNSAFRQAILESDYGARIQYYLAQNPEEFERINDMAPGWQLRAVGRLEQKIADELERKANPTRETVTVDNTIKRPKAPEPISAVRGVASADTMMDANGNFTGTPAQYRELRKAGKIR